MTGYNGHKNWTHWNVALWLGNDEGLYNTAIAELRRCGTARAAAWALLGKLPAKTPDGARYSITSLTAALQGMKEG